METLLRFQQGDTWAREIEWTNDDDTPVDLTGATARMQLRSSVNSPQVVLELTSEDGIAVDPAGKLTIQVAAPMTALMPAGLGVYDLEVSFPSEVVQTVIRGSYIVTPEVTR